MRSQAAGLSAIEDVIAANSRDKIENLFAKPPEGASNSYNNWIKENERRDS
jgi:hypothetical protein